MAKKTKVAAEIEKQRNPSPKVPLTARQNQIYEFIKRYIADKKYPPTIRNIGAAFNITSPNGVSCHLKALQKKNWITMEAHLSRTISIL